MSTEATHIDEACENFTLLVSSLWVTLFVCYSFLHDLTVGVHDVALRIKRHQHSEDGSLQLPYHVGLSTPHTKYLEPLNVFNDPLTIFIATLTY